MIFRYNFLVRNKELLQGKEVSVMFHMNNGKKNQRISAVIVILLVLAMIVPLVTSIIP